MRQPEMQQATAKLRPTLQYRAHRRGLFPPTESAPPLNCDARYASVPVLAYCAMYVATTLSRCLVMCRLLSIVTVCCVVESVTLPSSLLLPSPLSVPHPLLASLFFCSLFRPCMTRPLDRPSMPCTSLALTASPHESQRDRTQHYHTRSVRRPSAEQPTFIPLLSHAARDRPASCHTHPRQPRVATS